MAYTAQPVGFLADVVQRIQDAINEPVAREKWTTDRLWPKIVDAWDQIMDDVNGSGENPVIIHWALDVSSTTQEYVLPSNFGTFLKIGRLEETTGFSDEVAVPRSFLNPGGPRLQFTGNKIRFEPLWGNDETLQIDYIPSGYCPLHLGFTDTSSGTASSTTLDLDYEPEEGYFDRAPGAYIGAVLRLLSSEEVEVPNDYTVFPIQERVITAVDLTTVTATFSPALDFDPTIGSLGQCKYEIVPFLGFMFRGAIAWRVAAMILSVEEPKRASPLHLQYKLAMRKIRSKLNNMNARTGQRFHGDVPGNSRFGWSA